MGQDIKFPTSEELPPEAQMYLDLWRLRYGHEWVRLDRIFMEDNPEAFECVAWGLLEKTGMLAHHYETMTSVHLLKLKE